jgi:ABC-2 type transport system ATP-binding protein
LIGRSPKLGGTLQVAGVDAIGQPRRLQKISTAARIGKYIDLEPRHSVTQALLDRTAYEGLRRTDADRSYRRAAEILELKVADDELVEDLSRYQQSLFAVALACLRENTLLVLDDADRGLNIGDQVRLYQALDALIDATGTTVVVSSVEPASIPADASAVELPAAGTTKMHSR